MQDFGRAESLEPEAIGEPGNRTFRLRAKSGSQTASLWLEKEQLAALTLAIRQLLEQTARGEPPDEPEFSTAGAFPEQAKVDFKVGRLGIGYDEERHLVGIFAYDQGADDDAQPAFACQANRGQCRALAERAEEVISAGRPLCVLCGGPIEGGKHQCRRRNGHAPHEAMPE